MLMFRIYFKTTFRSLWRSKGYSFLNIFGLAIGIACAGLIFLWAENELTFVNANFKKDRLYQLEVNMTADGNEWTMGSTPRRMGAAIKTEIPGITNTARFSDQDERCYLVLMINLYAPSAVIPMLLYLICSHFILWREMQKGNNFFRYISRNILMTL